MAFPTNTLTSPDFRTELPTPFYFRTACVPEDSAYPKHTHPWGEFIYSFSGVMEVRIAGKHYLAPPQYGLWLPPNLEHQGLSRYESCHCSLYIFTPLLGLFPDTPCALKLTPLVHALLDHLRQTLVAPPYSDPEQRMLQVLVDQLSVADPLGSYLPSSQDPLLAPILELLDRHPGDNRPLADLARLVHSTERTLMRRAQRDLGMSLAEWKQRLRAVKATPKLEAGEKVESIALELGYSSASAFISMFRKLMGITPDEYRRYRG